MRRYAKAAALSAFCPISCELLEIAHKDLNELHITETMHERQVGMADRSDAFNSRGAWDVGRNFPRL